MRRPAAVPSRAHALRVRPRTASLTFYCGVGEANTPSRARRRVAPRAISSSRASTASRRTSSSSSARWTTSERSSPLRTWSWSAAGTPRTCSRSGGCTASIWRCATRTPPGRSSPVGPPAHLLVRGRHHRLVHAGPHYCGLARSAQAGYDSEERRPIVYAREIAAGLPGGIALDDGVAARYDDERLVEVVSARPEGRAFRVGAGGEEALAIRLLT